MFRMKIYKVGKEILVAVCDSDIVGKKFSENELVRKAKSRKQRVWSAR